MIHYHLDGEDFAADDVIDNDRGWAVNEVEKVDTRLFDYRADVDAGYTVITTLDHWDLGDLDYWDMG